MSKSYKPINEKYINTTGIMHGRTLLSNFLDNFVNNIIDKIYPIGTYYETSDTNFDPNTQFGGTWVEDTSGRVTVAISTDTEFDTVGKTGGSKTHKLTIDEMPKHNHLQYVGANNGNWGIRRDYNQDGNCGAYHQGNTANKGGDQPHNNLQPYIVVKRWHRTA